MLFRSDACRLGVGATLSQIQQVYNKETGKTEEREVILGYASRKLNSAENFYSSYRLELNGLILALNHFRYYLQGRHFTVYTDHRALEWIRTTQNPLIPSILIRLYESIADFDFNIKYVTPSKVACEDGISRLPFAGNHNMASWRVSGRDPWLMEDYFWKIGRAHV